MATAAPAPAPASLPPAESRPRPVVRAECLVWRDDRLLLVCNRQPKVEAGWWSLPGGGHEIGELLEETAVRETLEETSVRVTSVRRLAYLMQDERSALQDKSGGLLLSFAFEAAATEGDVVFQDEDIQEARFFTVPEAIALIDSFPPSTYYQPLRAYLTGSAPPGAA